MLLILVLLPIIVSHSVKDMTTEFTWKRGRLFDKEACEAFLDICQENPTATVELVENKPKNKWRPVPLDTIVCCTIFVVLVCYRKFSACA